MAEIRLFGEAADAQRAVRRIRRTGLDISVAGFGASRADAEHNDVFSGSGDLDSPAESRAILSRIGDDVIGGKQAKHRLGIVTKQKKCRQSNRGSGVASGGLGDDLLRVKLRKLTKDGGTQIVIGDDPETARRGHGCEARDRLLDHGLLAIERKQLLGAALAAQRPEARAAAASQNHGIEVRVRFHSRRKPNICAPGGKTFNHRGTEDHREQRPGRSRSVPFPVYSVPSVVEVRVHNARGGLGHGPAGHAGFQELRLPIADAP